MPSNRKFLGNPCAAFIELRMDLRSLRYFSEVASTENFSRAASRLHRTQPALSRCVRDLEAELGVLLFERVGRRAVITSAGKALLERVRSLLAQADAVSDFARLLAAGKTSVLRVGAVPNMIERVLPDVLRRYRLRRPEVEVVLRPEGGTALLRALENGDVDLALARYIRTPSLDAKPAFPFYVLAVVPLSHALARKRTVTVRELSAERLLAAPAIMASRALFEAACQESRVRPRIALESTEFNALMALAKANQGIAVVPSSAAAPDPTVKILPILQEGKALGAWAALVWDKRRTQTDYSRAFVQQACAQLRKSYPGRELRLPLPDMQLSRAGLGV